METGNIKTLTRFKVGMNVTLTSGSTVQYGTVRGFALNSVGEVVVGVEVIGELFGDFQVDNKINYYHPCNKITVIEPI